MAHRHKPCAVFELALAAFMLMTHAGCSSWPWASGSRDAERLTRVIHAENARLKDVVVQLRSSNEDMAQRALDDAARIARLEGENEQFRSSIGAYQSERERMARSFQNLQEQVRLALGERSGVMATSFTGTRPASAPAANAPGAAALPPEGQIGKAGDVLEVPLASWFAGDSALLAEGVEPRLGRLGRWLSTRLPRQGSVHVAMAAGFGGFVDGQAGTSPEPSGDQAELRRNRIELETLRARRLWEALQAHLPADSAARIRFEKDANPTPSETPEKSSARIVIPLVLIP